MKTSIKVAAALALGSHAVQATQLYDDKAVAINARLAQCMASSDALDTCIDDWSDSYSAYNRPDSYSISSIERQAFTDNIAAVIALNSNSNLTWVADLNAFSHWNLTTFSKRYLAGNLTLPSADSLNYRIERRALSLPSVVDWSSASLNGSTPLAQVKDQGELGVSWAFAAVGALESAIAISSNGTNTPLLSELFAISGTDDLYKNITHKQSCSGGSTWDALLFASSQGVALESTYPYTSVCPAASIDFSDAFIGAKSLREPVAIYAPQGNYTTAAMTRLAIQPVTVFTRIGIQSLFLYSEGIFTEVDECTNGTDHAMLLVGYNTTEQSYKVKNSFGSGWGESGFIRFAMNNNTQGPCNILKNMYYPSLAYQFGTIGEVACPSTEVSSSSSKTSSIEASSTKAVTVPTVVSKHHSRHPHSSAVSSAIVSTTMHIVSTSVVAVSTIASSSKISSSVHPSEPSSSKVSSSVHSSEPSSSKISSSVHSSEPNSSSKAVSNVVSSSAEVASKTKTMSGEVSSSVSSAEVASKTKVASSTSSKKTVTSTSASAIVTSDALESSVLSKSKLASVLASSKVVSSTSMEASIRSSPTSTSSSVVKSSATSSKSSNASKSTVTPDSSVEPKGESSTTSTSSSAKTSSTKTVAAIHTKVASLFIRAFGDDNSVGTDMQTLTDAMTTIPSQTSAFSVESMTVVPMTTLDLAPTSSAIPDSTMDLSGFTSAIVDDFTVIIAEPTLVANLFIRAFNDEISASGIQSLTVVSAPIPAQTSVVIVASMSIVPMSSIVVSSIKSTYTLPTPVHSSNTVTGSKSFTRSFTSQSTSTPNLSFAETYAYKKRRNLIRAENIFAAKIKTPTYQTSSQNTNAPVYHALPKFSSIPTKSMRSSSVAVHTTKSHPLFYKRNAAAPKATVTRAGLQTTTDEAGVVHITFGPKSSSSTKIHHLTNSFVHSTTRPKMTSVRSSVGSSSQSSAPAVPTAEAQAPLIIKRNVISKDTPLVPAKIRASSSTHKAGVVHITFGPKPSSSTKIHHFTNTFAHSNIAHTTVPQHQTVAHVKRGILNVKPVTSRVGSSTKSMHTTIMHSTVRPRSTRAASKTML